MTERNKGDANLVFPPPTCQLPTERWGLARSESRILSAYEPLTQSPAGIFLNWKKGRGAATSLPFTGVIENCMCAKWHCFLPFLALELIVGYLGKSNKKWNLKRTEKPCSIPLTQILLLTCYFNILKVLFVLILCVGVFANMHVHPPHECLVPEETRGGHWSPGTEIVGGCAPCVGPQYQSQIFCRKRKLLTTAEPLLLPPQSYFYYL